MIKFPCMCKLELEVPDELAGGLIQCPQCGRLNDVPSLSDVAHLRDDGTIDLRLAEEAPASDRLQVLGRVFGKPTADDGGAEIDLRPTPEEIARAGDTPESSRREDRVPRYDPITGERIQPLEIKEDPRGTAGPIPVAKAALTYSTDPVPDGFTAGRLLLELFMPLNVFVMFFIFLLHAAAQALAMSVLLSIFIIPLSLLILAHYANVVESTGPDAHDDLPRPLRDVNLWDDLWAPMGQMLFALGLAFGPAIFVMVWNPIPAGLRAPLAAVLAVVGLVFLPALILTSITGTTIANLRPDRLLGVIGACGSGYLVSVVACLVALGIYLGHIFGYYLIPDPWITSHPWLNVLVHPVVEYTTLAAAVYCGHFFTWHLGILYRRHYEQFPWVLQRHIPRQRPAAGGGGAGAQSLQPASGRPGQPGQAGAQASSRHDKWR